MINKKNLVESNNIIKDDKITIKFNMNMIIVGILSILVFVSVIQTVTLANLIGKKPDSANNSQTTTGQTASNGNTALPTALKDVPQQVGGC